MNFIQKKIASFVILSLATLLYACNNSDEKKEEPVKTADSAVSKTIAPNPAPFTPFDVLEITHTVKDYAAWKPVFDADSTARKANGMEGIVVGRSFEKNNNLLVVLKVSDVQKAKAFTADPRLKAAMDKGGVISKPNAEFFHVIRFNADSKEKQWVAITHKVKDFDTWLKAFDAEGSATRAANGMIDVVLSRGIDDPNIVHVVFDIKDMEKAKARINSPDLKKVMTDAGVISAPKIEFYTSAE